MTSDAVAAKLPIAAWRAFTTAAAAAFLSPALFVVTVMLVAPLLLVLRFSVNQLRRRPS